MYDKLTLMLQKMAHPEVALAFTNSLNVLDMYGYLDPWGDISAYIESGPEVSTAVFMDVIESILITGLDNVLRQMTILVDGNHEFKSQVLEGLKVLENYEDAESILMLIDLGNSATETLAELLALATPLQVEELMLKLIDCSDALIEGIKKTYSGDAALESAELVPTVEDKKKSLVQYILQSMPNCLAATALNREFMPYGLPIEVLLRKYSLELSLLQPDAPQQAALELILLVCISDTAYGDIQSAVKANLDTLYGDIEFITMMNLTVDGCLNEVLNHG